MGFFDIFKKSPKSKATLDQELLSACESADAGWVSAKLDAGANPNASIQGVSALLKTIRRRKPSQIYETAIANAGLLWSNIDRIAALLVRRGATVDLADGNGSTPLMEACRIGHTDLIKFLLDSGAKSSINQTDKTGQTALFYALGSKCREYPPLGYEPEYLEIVKLLLEYGANADVTDLDGKPAIDWATGAGREVVDLMASRGADSFLSRINDDVLNLALDMLREKFRKLDDDLDYTFSMKYGPRDKQRKVDVVFLLLTSSLLGVEACIDGFPSSQELGLWNRLLQVFELSDKHKMALENIFKYPAKTPGVVGELTAAFRLDLDAFNKIFGHDPKVTGTLASLLFDMGYADGTPNPAEQTLLELVTTTFGINRSDYELHGSDEGFFQEKTSIIESYYSVIRSKPTDSDDEIKQQYRKLAKDYHPDVIQGKGLPEDFVKFANAKFQEIQQAYEKVMESRTRRS